MCRTPLGDDSGGIAQSDRTERDPTGFPVLAKGPTMLEYEMQQFRQAELVRQAEQERRAREAARARRAARRDSAARSPEAESHRRRFRRPRFARAA
ncbi:hypothetical protein GCM10009535_44870 [Streptomyces thermocarboxydovorans]|uniref:Uncharacterized protein n=2 Tax=Streptomyces thermocarboxydovorans TaxID=59298 RepID=A0ABN1HNI3_9ACTN